MGIYDREYYRDKTKGSGWLTGSASVCKYIILANVGVFIFGKFYSDDKLIEAFAASSDSIFGHGQVYRLLTAAFLHNPEDIFHLLFNMLLLWFVGRDMEAFYGAKEFTWFYMSSAVIGFLAWALMDYKKPTHGIAFGASGAVMAVLALYTFYNPRREVILYFIPVEMWLLLAIYVGSDAYFLAIQARQPVAFAAHLGGVAYALMFKRFDLRLKHLQGFAFRRGPKLRIVTPPDLPRRDKGPSKSSASSGGVSSTVSQNRETSPSPVATRPVASKILSEESLEARVDEILVKIASSGRGSLSEEEKRILDEASRRARSRRGEKP
jgi:membrane associated rhomboid family serine protease